MDKPGKWIRSFLPAAFAAIFGMVGMGCVTTSSSGGYSLTSEGGIGATIDKPIDRVAASVQAAFSNQGVEVTETKNQTEGDKRVVKGKKGDLDVTVELSYNGANSTKAEVTARKHVVTYDKDFARQLMDDIVKGS
jgi:hypothetical protein